MTALIFLQHVNRVLGILFMVCYFYQFLYIPVALAIRRKKNPPAKKLHRYAVLISARNEEAVIGQLLDSIARQDYPADLVTTFVVADNCTDSTAQVARDAGAVVFERFNKLQVGKGYALDFLLDQIKEQYGAEWFDGYFVFDADNLLQRDYITRMNEVFDQGCAIVTSYRNSKNYGDNWISAGYALWFLRDAAFLNAPRAQLGISCVVAGTGFLFSGEIMRRCGGWPFHTLTEDTEFTVHNILQGEKIGYCGAAEIFDEQPTRLSQSWRQRLRWAKGYLQVLRKDGGRLAAGIFSKNGPSCFDMLMSILPAMVLTFCSVLFGSAATVLQLILGKNILPILVAFAASFAVPYLLLLLVGIITTATQWHSIRATAFKKVLYTFTFPLFMLTYIPISIAAIFSPKVEWKPSAHKVAVSLSEMK
mgnify:FL=1